MLSDHAAIQYLLTLPPQMVRQFGALEERQAPDWFACGDPEGRPLGSGGGTANLLIEAWRATAPGLSFKQWLGKSRKLVLHSGGQCRRLPAYAAVGKLLMPIPVFRWARGQRLDQSLLDLQVPEYERILNHAGPKTAVMVTSGDVLLRFDRDLPAFPDVDVLGFGMWVPAQEAKDFGVFFSPRGKPGEVAFFLQKPSISELRKLAEDYVFLVDTGMWLLSQRAVAVLFGRCGLDSTGHAVGRGGVQPYELYAQFGLALGREPRLRDEGINSLTSAVIPLPNAEFYHFGTTAQMIESVAELQNLVLDETRIDYSGAGKQSDLVTQNSRFEAPWRRDTNRAFWIENSFVPRGWQLTSEHVLTGVPENDWRLSLEPGVCLDFVPVGADEVCIRGYGFRDDFKGRAGDATTRWFGAPAANWFEVRGIDPGASGIEPARDIQECPLFPVMRLGSLTGEFIDWLCAAAPQPHPEYAESWRTTRRLAASEIGREVNLERLYAQRGRLRTECLAPMLRNFRWSVFFRLDLDSTARLFGPTQAELPEVHFASHDDPMHLVHDQMFRAAVLRARGDAGFARYEEGAFARLRELIAREAQLSPALPRRDVLEDQIVWARSPVRLDLAGGWTDTPPYCIEHGGKVLNVAVDLNGQPPIQVFARLSDRRELVIRSIDLGVEERVQTYEGLDQYAQPGSAFALAKAAFALAGFLPRFHASGGFRSLKEQLESFGAGIELSLLSAVPKGSGLGTSSILAATVLAALGDLCGLGWDRNVLFSRTLALEQMLTTGGGWQDQAGAIFRGIKLIETIPGLEQKPNLRWMPSHLFNSDHANRVVLLYYTGLTRLAKNILAEIVRGMFLNSGERLKILADIGANAEFAASALQQCDYGLVCEAVRKSWKLNQELDSGTNPPAVQAILDAISEWTSAAKLLGAGGGGYLLLFAKDMTAAGRIKEALANHPPNPRARFVDLSLSDTGLQLTRS